MATVGTESKGRSEKDEDADASRELERRTVDVVENLDSFLDELAEGHRRRMEEIVEWITVNGNLDREIEANVEVLAPLFQRWSIEICFVLRIRGTQRFNELQESLGGIGSRTLSKRLKDLQGLGLVHREAFAEVPVRVEYSLTPKGLKMGDLLMPVIAHLRISGLREDGQLPESTAADD